MTRILTSALPNTFLTSRKTSGNLHVSFRSFICEGTKTTVSTNILSTIQDVVDVPRENFIEGSWSEAKQAGGSTQEMNHGHRHDSLNDMQNDWNWTKNQNMGTIVSYF
jgi:hypothetical protein